jgi:hypothetical protein
MIFNPTTGQLFTDEMVFIKKMQCPFNIPWSQLELGEKVGTRNCNKCVREIIDTRFLLDHELLAISQINPNACFKIDELQKNLTLVVKYEKA